MTLLQRNTKNQLKCDAVVIGWGLTGQSVARFLLKKGVRLVAMDTRKKPPQSKENLESMTPLIKGEIDHDFLEISQQIIISPGIGKADLGFDIIARYGAKVIGDIELFAQSVEAPVIAITGTNGKTTVTNLVCKMLKAGGLKVLKGGNVGRPALDLLSEPVPDFYVLELSSFQLETTYSLKPTVAAVVNFAEDHLDRYGCVQDYLKAKLKILKNAQVAVLNSDDDVLNSVEFSGQKVRFGQNEPTKESYGLTRDFEGHHLSKGSVKYADIESLRICGKHNITNALASLAICGVVIELSPKVIRGLQAFEGLPHRSELVGTFKGTTFIDDSKATNISATKAGINACLSEKKGVLILGGLFKGGNLEDLIKTIEVRVHTVVLIGQSAELFYRLLRGRVPCIRANCMTSAVGVASAFAADGEVVLLSPACSSLDMFSGFEARGLAFKNAIQNRVKEN